MVAREPVKSVRFHNVITKKGKRLDANTFHAAWWSEDELFQSRENEIGHLMAGHAGYEWRGLESYKSDKSYWRRIKEIEYNEKSILKKSIELRAKVAVGKSSKEVDASLQKFASKHSKKHREKARKRGVRDQEEAMKIYRSSSDEWAASLMSYVNHDRRRSNSLDSATRRRKKSPHRG